MTTEDMELEKLITASNSFEQQALDLIAENEKLASQVTGYQKRVCSMCDGHGMIGNCLDSIDCPDCVALDNKVKADAIDEFFKYMIGECLGSDNGVDAVLDDYLNDNLLTPVKNHYVDKLRGNNG